MGPLSVSFALFCCCICSLVLHQQVNSSPVKARKVARCSGASGGGIVILPGSAVLIPSVGQYLAAITILVLKLVIATQLFRLLGLDYVSKGIISKIEGQDEAHVMAGFDHPDPDHEVGHEEQHGAGGGHHEDHLREGGDENNHHPRREEGYPFEHQVLPKSVIDRKPQLPLESEDYVRSKYHQEQSYQSVDYNANPLVPTERQTYLELSAGFPGLPSKRPGQGSNPSNPSIPSAHDLAVLAKQALFFPVDLAAKVEHVFRAMESADDESCLLRMVCEMALEPDGKPYGLFGQKVNNLFKFMGSPRPISAAFRYQRAFYLGSTKKRGICHQTFDKCFRDMTEYANSWVHFKNSQPS